MATDRVTTLQEDLAESREYLEHIIEQAGNKWDTQVYSDGLQWTIRQLLIHLADADRGHNAQAMNIAEGKDLIPEDFDIERYNRRVTEKTAEKTAEQAIEELRASRQQLNDWLFNIDASKLDMKGRHASLRIMSVEEILRWTVVHERHHAEHIAAAIGLDTE